MDYARYDNQTAPASWNPDQSAPIIQQPPPPQPPQPQLQPDLQQQISKPNPHVQLIQPPPIVYGTTTHQPITNYDISVNWTPQMVPQGVIEVPQWPTTNAPIGNHVPIDPNGPPPPVVDPCIHSATHSQPSHYNQYPTLQPAGAPPEYWNPDIVTSQPTNLDPSQAVTTTSALPGGIPTSDPALIEDVFSLNQPSMSSTMQPADVTVIPPPPAQQPQQLALAPFDDQLVMGNSSQVGQIVSGIADDPGSLEDALEVIKNHAENYSGSRQTCSSTSGDDDDEHSRGPRGGEREKERRQANNARER